MVIILFGKPLVFWLGFVVLAALIIQIILGVVMTVGKNYKVLKYHKINAGILVLLVLVHMILGLLLYL